ncbi:U6 snRNA-associated Sm-like protein LSm6, putative (LSM6) [Plasmodium ovale wallikeri]|uniref:U6 snRNA-associated Sm-like protein LSm6, putative n=3 Tax=Plasmodium ovale TaxID=36330 RepID=A0A1C3KVF2_PLAOA|nr:U6 snRNA-associated Sm-like protein LSm6, putative (LSM6) [Plasmodium ovale curtisi]SBT41353.1 U6 snRNA-associated Sm-like protein LSm6, putative (LSM6) [Plasmodium ovale wallikeri]SBT78171.1 U6 snRNA-associated Sm-like protein LSm6, putative [Plasmodium ovale]SBS96510.1 U6 snRNA-associated Sm-like protein LSm6, putative (LSM6) [Plasmodium ovale curtisi]SBT41731.1 U6 snRNA-associated Sm-like protein LSm6, putative (LSM6) [Plasmodium ovale wallikeri]
MSSNSPKDFVESLKGRAVIVRLNNGADYKGILACLDERMNVALEQTEEYFEGELIEKYNDAFIRGNNVFYIRAIEEE